MNKRKSRLLILLSVIVAMILCVGVFCACEKDEITYSVMLPSGEHYTVTSNNIVKVSKDLAASLPEVGGGLMDGCNPNIKIYVPKNKYGIMKTDYFWSAHAKYLVSQN